MHLIRHPSVHQCGDVVDLLVVALLQELSVTVRVLHGDTVSHGERHEPLVKYELTLLSKVLELSKRHRLSPSALEDLFDTERPILLFPPSDKLFGVIRVVSQTSNVIPRILDKVIQIGINCHHVKHSAV